MSTKIQILANTNYAIAEVIKSELLESAKVNIAVAFLRKSGIDQIFKALDYALTKNNAKVEIIVGLDFKTTDYSALLTLEEIGSKYSGFNRINSLRLAAGSPYKGRVRETNGFSDQGFQIDTPQLAAGRFIIALETKEIILTI